jgi:acetyl esterase/lipase
MLPQSTWREAANERDLKLEQAVQFLNGPDFIPAESQPAQLDFIPDTSGGRFRFPTPRPCEFAENNVVHGRLYRCADAWQERPVIVSLHGGGDLPGNQLGFHLFARRCLRAGFNAATLEFRLKGCMIKWGGAPRSNSGSRGGSPRSGDCPKVTSAQP